MPELPDIVTYISALEPLVVGQSLQRVRLASAFLLRTAQPPVSSVEGRVVHQLRRIGKRIAIGVDGDLWLVLHLMIAGRLHWKKGYEHALSALSALHERGVEFEYRIIGDGPHREAILFALDELDLLERVELLGARDVREVQEAMRWADVCLHAAVSEDTR